VVRQSWCLCQGIFPSTDSSVRSVGSGSCDRSWLRLRVRRPVANDCSRCRAVIKQHASDRLLRIESRQRPCGDGKGHRPLRPRLGGPRLIGSMAHDVPVTPSRSAGNRAQERVHLCEQIGIVAGPDVTAGRV
jgi:bacterioferritin-associated ferredoxin